MAGRISCCLNLHLHLQDSISAESSSPLLKTKSQISWRTEDETKPRKDDKCSLVLGMAATILIGSIEICHVPSVEAVVVESPVKEIPPRRWSDKRMCPSWLKNSLETIVPENLPRPSRHRRLELAGLAESDAPPVGAVVTRGNKAACFSV